MRLIEWVWTAVPLVQHRLLIAIYCNSKAYTTLFQVGLPPNTYLQLYMTMRDTDKTLSTTALNNTNISFYKRLLLWVLIPTLGLVVFGVFAMVLPLLHIKPIAAAEISVVMQNLIVMTIPAAIIAAMVSVHPLQFMCVNTMPKWTIVFGCIVLYAVFFPLLTYLTEWNKQITLPASLSDIEQSMMQLEQEAEKTMRVMIGNQSTPAMIVNVLSIGIMTGIGEELLFRGALQRILQCRPMNIHVAIFITAAIFSAVHFQFYGFVPRLVFGMLLGYIMYLTGSVWCSALIHAINNSSVVVMCWLFGYEAAMYEGNPFPKEVIWVSIALTLVALLAWNVKKCKK